MYMSFDPGQTTGWAIFNDMGEPIAKGQTSLDDLPEMLAGVGHDIHVVIYEGFKLFKHKAVQQSGSDMPASQAIGCIRSFAYTKNAKLVQQQPNIKPIAEKFSGVKPIGPHSQSHWVDAYNHGIYYLVSIGVAESALEREQRLGK